MRRFLIVLGLTCFVGCTAVPKANQSQPAPATSPRGQQTQASTPELDATHELDDRPKFDTRPERLRVDGHVQMTSYLEIAGQPEAIEDLEFPTVAQLSVAPPLPPEDRPVVVAAQLQTIEAMPEVTATPSETATPRAIVNSNSVVLNLPTVLSRVDSRHPAVGVAQWRVQEAYARLAQSRVLWLPSINAGFSFHRHDGNYQASDGTIVDVNRNSFQYGLGMGATGAGTTPRPGVVARFHLADAIFQPKVTEKTAWARSHAARAVTNQQLATAATAYVDLLNAHQDTHILQQSHERTSHLAEITSDFAAAGEGLRADADRLRTEQQLVSSRIVGSHEEIAMASARLAQAISLSGGCQIIPTDVTVVPLQMASANTELPCLIEQGLARRPELKESRALVAAACEAYRREKYATFVPSVLLGFSTGGFGGGLSDNLDNIDSRYDFDALMSWEVRNLGLGEKAMRRAASSRIQQAKYEAIRVMDQVAREISEAHAQIRFRQEQMEITQRAIESATTAYELNLARIRDGQGLPIEVLQSIQALESSQRAYLEAVSRYNAAQFRLQWAMGWPVEAPGAA